jgi:hypothetical protein
VKNTKNTTTIELSESSDHARKHDKKKKKLSLL